MNNTLFGHNLSFLRDHFPELAGRLAPSPDRRDGDSPSLVYTERPHPNILAGTGSLHSRTDPWREAARFFADLQAGEGTLLLFLGLGLGYQVEELRRRYGKTFGGATVVVVERSVESFSLLLAHRDISFLKGAVLFVGNQAGRLLDWLEGLSPHRFSGYRIIRLRGACRLFPASYDRIEEAFRRLMSGKLSDLLTRVAFESLWMRNVIDNVPFLVGRATIRSLRGVLRGRPALVLGAGPSLDRQLDLVRGAAADVPVIAVDTVLGPLLASGVRPHLVVTLDAQLYSLRDFTRSFTGDHGPPAVLAADLVSCPQVVKRWRGPVCFSQTALPVRKEAEPQRHPLPGLLDRVHPVPALECGGSVTTTAIELALFLDASPVLVAGLDLAYTGYRTHLRETPFDRDAALAATRLSPALTPTIDAIRRRRTRKLPALDGGRVLSDFVFENYLRWFQDRERYRGRVFNASAEGARIPGLARVDLGKALEDAARGAAPRPAPDPLRGPACGGPVFRRSEARTFLADLDGRMRLAREQLCSGVPAGRVAARFCFVERAASALSASHRDERSAAHALQDLLDYLRGRVARSLKILGEK